MRTSPYGPAPIPAAWSPTIIKTARGAGSASNVLYTLSTTQSSQPRLGTNGFLPAFVFNALGGFQGSRSPHPTRNVSFELGGLLVATNTSSTAVIFRFAASNDGLIWQTNYQSFTYTIPVNSFQGASGGVLTNIDTGGTAYILPCRRLKIQGRRR